MFVLRIHPPDVIGKYAPESVIGKVGSGAPAAAPAAGGGLAEPLLAKGGHQDGGGLSHQLVILVGTWYRLIVASVFIGYSPFLAIVAVLPCRARIGLAQKRIARCE